MWKPLDSLDLLLQNIFKLFVFPMSSLLAYLINEQQLLTLTQHLSATSVYSGVRVTRSLVLCVYFVDRRWSFCPFSFGHCVVCPFTIYGF